ncbi:universal stress protein [Comamonas sp. NLF-1-9]|uniref:universal stress protein n=1 Tax=Comamonas sp. NLF-1-9 TaxID=2853163 RepID=UPI001C47C69D|nr:universal stress protein [Comamonas sp. NLF-1-9]QXL84590.1 universal stress protein [Comamonas sp. NLF-1-9]
MYQRILIATDGSPLSDKAVEHGLQLAALSRGRVLALRVLPRYPRKFFDGGLALDEQQIRQIEEQWRDEAQAALARVKKRGSEEGVMVKTLTPRSDQVAEAILAAARKNGCDLIVMASHGRRGVKRLLLGSETQNVLTHAEIPVLVLR